MTAATADRYDAIDLVRGWALLGVAMVNVHAMARGWTNHYALDFADTWYDVMAEYAVGLLFAHRAFPALAFLLGVGLVFQWRSLTHADETAFAHARRVMRSRYLALLFLGVLHGLLLWPGDIVSSYAIVVLLLLWKWPKRDVTLKRFIVILSALGATLYALAIVSFAVTAPSVAADDAPSFAYSSWRAAIAMHPSEFFTYGLIQALLPEVWIALLVGVWVAQTGALERWLNGEAGSRVAFRLGFVSFAFGTLLELVASRLGAWDFVVVGGIGGAVFSLGVPLVMFGSVFVLLAIARAWPRDRLAHLRELLIAAGRAPLTLFFGMSLVMIPIFHASLGDWHGELGRAAYAGVALLTFGLLAGFVRAWLASGHRRGPFEAVWMTLATRLRGSGR